MERGRQQMFVHAVRQGWEALFGHRICQLQYVNYSEELRDKTFSFFEVFLKSHAAHTHVCLDL